jgi:uncharacterized damage-inducible protein DinB
MRYTWIAVLLTMPAWTQDAANNPQLASAKAFYVTVRANVLKSADKMPEEKYGFRPTDDVRTYGQMLAHIADAQFFLCGTAKEGVSRNRGIEKAAKTKADILKGLNDGFAYCDAAFAELTDASSAAMVPFFGQQRTKLSMLSFNTAHTFEHYGNLATYMRMNKIVPPSSEPPPAAAPTKPTP